MSWQQVDINEKEDEKFVGLWRGRTYGQLMKSPAKTQLRILSKRNQQQRARIRDAKETSWIMVDHGVSWCFGTSLAPLRLGDYVAGLTSTRRFGGSTYG
jgi:hypothetical protein